MTWQQIGLTTYITTTALAVGLLLFDLYLRLSGQRMITDFCRVNPWAAYLILVGLAFGHSGLAVHFMAPVLVEVRAGEYEVKK